MNTSEISNIISTTINDLFYRIFASIDNSLYSLLDEFTFIDSGVLKESYFDDIFGIESGEGILLIANSLIVGFLIYYSFRFILSYLGVTQVEHPAQFLFKLFLCAIAMNFSPFICYEFIDIIDLLSRTIRYMGESLLHTPVCFSSIISKLNPLISIGQAADIFSIDGFIKSLVSIGLLNLMVAYAVRYVLIKIFVLLSPFAFLSLCNKSTSVLFHSWLKSFISLLLVQILVAIILLLILSLNAASHQLFSKFVFIGAVFVLIKANHYVREMLGGISSDVGVGFNQLKSTFLNRG